MFDLRRCATDPSGRQLIACAVPGGDLHGKLEPGVGLGPEESSRRDMTWAQASS